MQGSSGTQFDPSAVSAFERALADGTLKLMIPDTALPIQLSSLFQVA